MKDLILSYTRYNLWANTRVVDFIRDFQDAQMHREITSSFSSLHKTIFHTYGAQSLWISRLHGNSPAAFPPADSLSPAETMQGLLDTSRQLISFVEHSTDESLQEKISYKNLAGVAFTSATWEILQHVVNHSTHHRGQVVTMLRHLGHEKLFDSDYITYTRE